MSMRRRQRGSKRNVGDGVVLRDNELIAINGSKTCRVINFKEPYSPILLAMGGAYW